MDEDIDEDRKMAIHIPFIFYSLPTEYGTKGGSYNLLCQNESLINHYKLIYVPAYQKT